MSESSIQIALADEDREALGDWWDDETTVGIESAYPVVNRIARRQVAQALRDAADVLVSTVADLRIDRPTDLSYINCTTIDAGVLRRLAEQVIRPVGGDGA